MANEVILPRQIRGSVVLGDIARIPADAIVTAINSGGMWFGGIDGVIQRNAGDQFHAQAQAEMPLSDGRVIIARGNGSGNRAQFKNVVFVVDDLRLPLREVIFRGLKAADEAGFRVVSLPAIRMGVMLGVVEKSVQEAGNETISGIRQFLASNPQHIEELHFVVYNDQDTQRVLDSGVRGLLPPAQA